MIEMTYEQVIKAVQMLRPEQKAALVKTIELESWAGTGVTRAQLLAESEALRALGAFDRPDSLRNRFANPSVAYVTDHQLLSVIHEAAVEWETDLAEIADFAGEA
jgi:hypothetical protein